MGSAEENVFIKNNGSRTANYGSVFTEGRGSMSMRSTIGEQRGATAVGNGDGRPKPEPSPPPPLHEYRVRFVGDGVCVDGWPDGSAGGGPAKGVANGGRPDAEAGDHGWPWTLLDGHMSSAAARLVATVVAVAVAWCLLRVNVATDLTALPGGSVASVFVLYVAGAAAGRVTATVGRGRVPPLLGMMVAGIALQNCGLYTVTENWCVELVAIMREAALSVILVKGGLELNARQLRRHSSAVVKLALLPCVAEALAAAVVAHYVLSDFSWEWSLSLGFILSAVSPAVLVPSLSRLKKMGYGEDSGVNTLVIAASSLDDIVSISAFGVLMGIVFSTGDLNSKIIQGPVDVSIGTALGLVWGFFLIFVPPSPWAKVYKKKNGNNQDDAEKQATRSVTVMRAFLLGAGGVLAVTGSQLYGYPGAGPLACIVSAFVAANGWRWRAREHDPTAQDDGGGDDDGAAADRAQDDPVEGVFECVWYGLQPVLFASIGTEIKFGLLAGGDVMSAGLLVLVGGLIVRLIVTTCAVGGTKLNRKEVTFINIAWLPKATVQAALAPVALDLARSMGTDGDVETARRLLTIAVISILVTAPIGAFGIQFLGPVLLSKSSR